MNEQIRPRRLIPVALASAALLGLGGCGLDADEETSTATTPPAVEAGPTGPSGPSGPTGATGAEDAGT